MNKLTVIAVVLLVVGMCVPAGALPFSFERLSSNSSSGDIGDQFTLDILDAGGGYIDFLFLNDVGLASSIAGVYIGERETDPYLDTSGGVSIFQSAGVSFFEGAAPAGLRNQLFRDLAGIEVRSAFLAGSYGAPNGIDSATEFASIRFDLAGTFTYQDVIDAMNHQNMSIGLHVQALPDGESDVYRTTTKVPDGGATALLLGISLVGLGALKRRG